LLSRRKRTISLAATAKNVFDLCPADEDRDIFRFPEFLQWMLDNRILGNKVKGGFFKKGGKDEKGRTIFLSLDPATRDYRVQVRMDWPLLKELKGIEDPAGVAQDLRIYQRLSRMTPRYSEIQALYNNGLHSSHAVVQWGEDAFVKKMGHPWGASRAREAGTWYFHPMPPIWWWEMPMEKRIFSFTKFPTLN